METPETGRGYGPGGRLERRPRARSETATAQSSGVRDSAKLKLAIGRAKIQSAIEADGGTTIYGAHLLPFLAPLLPAILDAGVRILEMTHSSLYLADHPPTTRVHQGGRFAALKASYTVPVEELVERIAQIRPALGEDVFLNIGAPGTFNQIGPAFFTDESAFLLSRAGADGIHSHQSNLDELRELVDIAHRFGLLVEAYIFRDLGPTHPFSYMGIVAETPREVRRAAAEMERIGVDIIGLMFSADPNYYSQEGATDHLPRDIRERLRALRGVVKVPVSVEGQLTPTNAAELRELGANILVLGSVFDIAIEDAIKQVVDDFRAAPAASPGGHGVTSGQDSWGRPAGSTPQRGRGGSARAAHEAVRDSARLKLAIGRAKIQSAIEAHDGTTIEAGHLLPHFAPLLPGIQDAGLRILEVSHGAIYLSKNPPTTRVHQGGRFAALKASYTVPVEELVERIAQIRPALAEEVYINAVPPGTFNQIGPAFFTDESAFLLSRAGADGIHSHQSNLDELRELVERAHKYGLLVESFIFRDLGPTHPFSYMGIVAETPREVRRAAAEMERIGVDIIGLMFSADPNYYSQEGATDHLPRDIRERLRALRGVVKVPVSVEGQLTPTNAAELRELGANILVLGSVFDIAIEDAIKQVVDDFRAAPRGEP